MPEASHLAPSLTDSYRGKRVLVTGHTGFKGGWLALWLKRLGAHVIGVSLEEPAAKDAFFHATRLRDVIDHRLADIRDAEAYAAATSDIDADIVFHLAAQALVRPSYTDPVGTFATNVAGTAVVLENARRMPSLRAVVVVTSDKCYENLEWHSPYRENDAMGGSDPYSASKGCAELLTTSFRRSFFSDPVGCQLATARAGNVIGGGDRALDRLLPDIVKATLADACVKIRYPASVRPWQHVLEPLSGYLLLGARLLGEQGHRFAEAWNFGPSAEGFIDVETLARSFQRAWGQNAAPITFDKQVTDLHEAGLLTLDSSKARARLHWKPRLSTAWAVAMTADWYRTCAQGRTDMRAFSEEQIEFYSGESHVELDDSVARKVPACA
jgi:CDP-glucose 4,6-dehydratase